MNISVVVPMFGREDLTDRMVGYLNKQSLDSFDLIVVDDGSETPYVLPEFTKGSSILIRHQTNRGVSCAWNSGALCGMLISDLICITNNDIEISDNLLESFVDFYTNSPDGIDSEDVGLLCPSVKVSSTNGELIPSTEWMYGGHGFCFCVPSDVYLHKWGEEGYCSDTNFIGADHEDLDNALWMVKYDYESVVIKSSVVWGNLSATSQHQIKPNAPYLHKKWGGKNLISRVISEISNGVKGRSLL
jgi:glycosyltransferase involved in cell wall biosynthesis